ncbi:MAG: hypothetical protein NT154_23570 [Verrucomicrobia bacterium]|nr:hypothetical protein [Verrucomicrobiota bacterium]
MQAVITSDPPRPGTAKGHPRGLYTLFFTEMWERFGYYGMRALLVLFMVDSVRGGMGMTDKLATSIYGLYTCAVYVAAVATDVLRWLDPGGLGHWIIEAQYEHDGGRALPGRRGATRRRVHDFLYGD